MRFFVCSFLFSVECSLSFRGESTRKEKSTPERLRGPNDVISSDRNFSSVPSDNHNKHSHVDDEKRITPISDLQFGVISGIFQLVKAFTVDREKWKGKFANIKKDIQDRHKRFKYVMYGTSMDSQNATVDMESEFNRIQNIKDKMLDLDEMIDKRLDEREKLVSPVIVDLTPRIDQLNKSMDSENKIHGLFPTILAAGKSVIAVHSMLDKITEAQTKKLKERSSHMKQEMSQLRSLAAEKVGNVVDIAKEAIGEQSRRTSSGTKTLASMIRQSINFLRTDSLNLQSRQLEETLGVNKNLDSLRLSLLRTTLAVMKRLKESYGLLHIFTRNQKESLSKDIHFLREETASDKHSQETATTQRSYSAVRHLENRLKMLMADSLEQIHHMVNDLEKRGSKTDLVIDKKLSIMERNIGMVMKLMGFIIKGTLSSVTDDLNKSSQLHRDLFLKIASGTLDQNKIMKSINFDTREQRSQIRNSLDETDSVLREYRDDILRQSKEEAQTASRIAGKQIRGILQQLAGYQRLNLMGSRSQEHKLLDSLTGTESHGDIYRQRSNKEIGSTRQSINDASGLISGRIIDAENSQRLRRSKLYGQTTNSLSVASHRIASDSRGGSGRISAFGINNSMRRGDMDSKWLSSLENTDASREQELSGLEALLAQNKKGFGQSYSDISSTLISSSDALRMDQGLLRSRRKRLSLVNRNRNQEEHNIGIGIRGDYVKESHRLSDIRNFLSRDLQDGTRSIDKLLGISKNSDRERLDLKLGEMLRQLDLSRNVALKENSDLAESGTHIKINLRNLIADIDRSHKLEAESKQQTTKVGTDVLGKAITDISKYADVTETGVRGSMENDLRLILSNISKVNASLQSKDKTETKGLSNISMTVQNVENLLSKYPPSFRDFIVESKQGISSLYQQIEEYVRKIQVKLKQMEDEKSIFAIDTKNNIKLLDKNMSNKFNRNIRVTGNALNILGRYTTKKKRELMNDMHNLMEYLGQYIAHFHEVIKRDLELSGIANTKEVGKEAALVVNLNHTLQNMDTQLSKDINQFDNRSSDKKRDLSNEMFLVLKGMDGMGLTLKQKEELLEEHIKKVTGMSDDEYQEMKKAMRLDVEEFHRIKSLAQNDRQNLLLQMEKSDDKSTGLLDSELVDVGKELETSSLGHQIQIESIDAGTGAIDTPRSSLGSITGNELKLLLHHSLIHSDDILKDVANAKGISIDKISHLGHVLGTFISLVESFMGEISDEFEGTRKAFRGLGDSVVDELNEDSSSAQSIMDSVIRNATHIENLHHDHLTNTEPMMEEMKKSIESLAYEEGNTMGNQLSTNGDVEKDLSDLDTRIKDHYSNAKHDLELWVTKKDEKLVDKLTEMEHSMVSNI